MYPHIYTEYRGVEYWSLFFIIEIVNTTQPNLPNLPIPLLHLQYIPQLPPMNVILLWIMKMINKKKKKPFSELARGW